MSKYKNREEFKEALKQAMKDEELYKENEKKEQASKPMFKGWDKVIICNIGDK